MKSQQASGRGATGGFLLALGANPRANRLLDGLAFLLQLRQPLPHLGQRTLSNGQRALAVTHAAEGRRQTVILDLPDRIELVIVTTGAVDGQTQERLSHGADDVFQLVLPHHALHGFALLRLTNRVVGTGDQKAGRFDGVRVVRSQHVAGQLQADELVVGHVAIEGIDNPVAIAPGIGTRLVKLEAVALAEAHHIEPVPRPADAVLRRVQIAIDQSFVRVWRAIVLEGRDFFRRRRQTKKIEG